MKKRDEWPRNRRKINANGELVMKVKKTRKKVAPSRLCAT